MGYRKTRSPGCLLHDVVVVDEASMLDLALAARLFGALGPDARIILLGDKDQLAAVEPGAVFSALAAAQGLSDIRAGQLADLLQCSISHIRAALPPAQGGGLQDCAIWLTRTYRFAEGSAIAALADAVRFRDVEAAESLLANARAEAGELVFIPYEGDSLARRIFDQLADGFAAFREVLAGASVLEEQSLCELFSAFGKFRVLCALREGPRGVETLNREIAARLDAGSARRKGRTGEWFKGRPVLISQNDHALGLFNGDVGIALPTDGESREGHPWEVVFEDPRGGFRRIPAVRLPAHETAFAMTVHKSQGTEFDCVAVVLPAARARVLSRELIYTAITRAREKVLLVGAVNRVTEALSSSTLRESGLARRLAWAPEEAK
jgi:exodeoxyribonuclease V alpha subunit